MYPNCLLAYKIKNHFYIDAACFKSESHVVYMPYMPVKHILRQKAKLLINGAVPFSFKSKLKQRQCH